MYSTQLLRSGRTYKNDIGGYQQFEYAFSFFMRNPLTDKQFSAIKQYLTQKEFSLISLDEYLFSLQENNSNSPVSLTRIDGANISDAIWVNKNLCLSVEYQYGSGSQDGLVIFARLKDKDIAHKILNDCIKELALDVVKKEGQVFLTIFEYGQLRLRGFKLSIPTTALTSVYHNDILSAHEKIVDKLKNSKPGVHLFYGEPGTGKTTYIRHLTKLVDKKFIFLPPNFGEMLANPAFVPFLMHNAENSVLVMEDAETVIKERDLTQNHEAIANVLNMTDGLIGDIIKPQIIFTFNCDLEKIDKALLRKGRCHSRIEFPKLETEKANLLAQEFKLNRTFTAPATLAEVVSDELATV